VTHRAKAGVSRFCHCNFSLAQSFRLPYDPAVVSAQSFRLPYDPAVVSVSKKIEYQEYFLSNEVGSYVRLTTLPLSCSDRHEIWKPQTPGILRACPGIALPLIVLLTNCHFNNKL
jgi:hypothetical protein